jgi:hypothetical protein
VDILKTLLVIIGGLAIRLAIPILITAMVVYLLRQLDAQWQSDVQQHPTGVIAAGQQPCWQVNGCPEEKRKNCPAANNPTVPCWQVYRRSNGYLKEACLGCEVLRKAPIPVKA